MTDPFDLSGDLPPSPPPAQAARPSYLDGLNDSQRRAVEATEGPVLVLAGAGTGKTRVLITRLAHILMEGRANPWQILAVTFTNKAAREMRDRVAELLGRPVEDWWVGTFHALAARILRTHAEAAGLKANFTILDQDDQTRLIKQLMTERGIDEKRHPARAVLGVIQRWKDRGLAPGKIPEDEGTDDADGQVLDIYADYQERLKAINAADFGDLLLHCVVMFQDYPDIAEKYQRKFRYLLVDEYQDTNVAQYLWLRLLAQAHGNICCVGDDDQSIYSWRGAEVENILRFEKDFPGAVVVRLERNYRSTPHILAAASHLISHNQGRLGKTLWTDTNDGDGEKIRLCGHWDAEQEARAVCGEVEAEHARGVRLDHMAALVRAGFQTREFEERLIALGVPYRVIGGPRFYERQEIRDAVAYLRIIAQPDDDLAFERIVNVPSRKIGKVTLQIFHQLARANSISLSHSVAGLLDTDELRPQVKATLQGLMDDFERWRGLMATMPVAELCEQVLDETGYVAMWRMNKSPDAPGRLDNLKELVAALEEFDSLGDFLEHVSLVMDNDDNTTGDKFNLMTLHGAKGLEFDVVFLPGWEEGLFPHQLAMEETGRDGLEEERRLAYVGLTRARKKAVVSFAANRQVYGQWQSAIPSRFIDELPPDHVETLAPPGLYGSGGSGGGSGFHEDGGAFTSRRRYAKTAKRQTSDLGVGKRVFHQKFGYGQIMAGDGDKLEIRFEKAGTKKVMASFVEAA